MYIAAVIYVLGMVATAIYVRSTSTLEVMSDEDKIDVRTPMALFYGILWPLFVPVAGVVHLLGKAWLARVVQRHGVAVYWWPPGLDHKIPGTREDYPPLDNSKVRDGRRVGAWGLLLTEDAMGDGRWHCVAKRQDSDGIAVDGFDNEMDARRAFRWTTETELDAALAAVSARDKRHEEISR